MVEQNFDRRYVGGLLCDRCSDARTVPGNGRRVRSSVVKITGRNYLAACREHSYPFIGESAAERYRKQIGPAYRLRGRSFLPAD